MLHFKPIIIIIHAKNDNAYPYKMKTCFYHKGQLFQMINHRNNSHKATENQARNDI